MPSGKEETHSKNIDHRSSGTRLTGDCQKLTCVAERGPRSGEEATTTRRFLVLGFYEILGILGLRQWSSFVFLVVFLCLVSLCLVVIRVLSSRLLRGFAAVASFHNYNQAK
ncbi:nuclear RNA polymerase D1A [Striga asiatica]|uniref:Nuclear RNA polymerase D1A n=1 Tax=Striga asiatica TaxID=4170 RepID=A0A5A7P2B1_STRAF|nr:nuclear RNA polymerase D1A [Striga asiatica]